MNMKPKKPLPRPQVQVDLSKAESLKCEDCENYLFIESYLIKKISAILSPTGEEIIAPVKVFSCGNCGKVPSIFIKGTGLDEQGSDDEESTESNLTENFLK